MSRTTRNSIRRNRTIELVDVDVLEYYPELVPVDEQLSDTQTRVTLDAFIRAHRWQLVSTARHHLGNRRQDAEDLVQDLCVEALEGQLALSSDPTEALDELLLEIRERCEGGGH